MTEENKIVELEDEDFEKVVGGSNESIQKRIDLLKRTIEQVKDELKYRYTSQEARTAVESKLVRLENKIAELTSQLK